MKKFGSFFLWGFVGVCAIVTVGLYGWMMVGAVAAIRESFSFEPYARPYRATVVRLDRHSSGRSTDYTSIVEVVENDGRSFRFTSNRSRAFNFNAVGDPVEVVRGPAGQFEINSTFYLWVVPGMEVMIVPVALGVAFLWPSGKNRRNPVAWPLRRLRRGPVS